MAHADGSNKNSCNNSYSHAVSRVVFIEPEGSSRDDDYEDDGGGGGGGEPACSNLAADSNWGSTYCRLRRASAMM